MRPHEQGRALLERLAPRGRFNPLLGDIGDVDRCHTYERISIGHCLVIGKAGGQLSPSLSLNTLEHHARNNLSVVPRSGTRSHPTIDCRSDFFGVVGLVCPGFRDLRAKPHAIQTFLSSDVIQDHELVSKELNR